MLFHGDCDLAWKANQAFDDGFRSKSLKRRNHSLTSKYVCIRRRRGSNGTENS
jgi:hypothetical protein